MVNERRVPWKKARLGSIALLLLVPLLLGITAACSSDGQSNPEQKSVRELNDSSARYSGAMAKAAELVAQLDLASEVLESTFNSNTGELDEAVLTQNARLFSDLSLACIRVLLSTPQIEKGPGILFTSGHHNRMKEQAHGPSPEYQPAIYPQERFS